MNNMKTKFIFFGGKGGVGKTSMAAAASINFAEKNKKVLIVSTDPAHSLSDSFEKKVGSEVINIYKKLYALEIDPKDTVKKLENKVNEFEQLKRYGLSDVFGMMDSSPGIDEIASFEKFSEFINSEEYDIIIFDTAPTGHTLKLLSLPDVLDSWIGKLISIKMKLSMISTSIKRILRPNEEPCDETIESLKKIKENALQCKKIMSDKNRTSFWLVCIPEMMSIYETQRMMKSMSQYDIYAKGIIINQLLPKNIECSFCSTRRKMQQKNLKFIKKVIKDCDIKKIFLLKKELKGIETLKKIGKSINLN